MRRLTEKKLIMLKPEQIRTARYQPRSDFDEEGLAGLAESIALLGMTEPIAVRRVRGSYEIIFGERRLRAAVMAGLRRVPCILYKIDERQAAFFSVANNLQKRSLFLYFHIHYMVLPYPSDHRSLLQSEVFRSAMP